MMEPEVKRFPSQIDTPDSSTPVQHSDKSHVLGFLPSVTWHNDAQSGNVQHEHAQNNDMQRSRWKPATFALALQFCALMMTLSLWISLNRDLPLLNNLYALGILQGGLAMFLAVLFRMDTWWRIIQFTFPIGLLAMQQLALPSWFYLAGFLFTLSLFWTTFRTQVPFYPSRPDVWLRVANHLPKDRSIHLIDIGSGLGDLVMHLARVDPHGKFDGIEIAPLPWLISLCRKKLRRLDNAGFILGNYEALDFAKFDVVFAYLSPAAMEALWQKASSGMKPGSQLMSYEFTIPGVEPDHVLSLEGRPPIYVWNF